MISLMKSKSLRGQSLPKAWFTGKNGKSSAWINDSNSYEGGVASNHVVVSREGIQQDKVYVELLGEEEKIQLKIGQTFEPKVKSLKDITENESLLPPVPVESGQ